MLGLAFILLVTGQGENISSTVLALDSCASANTETPHRRLPGLHQPRGGLRQPGPGGDLGARGRPLPGGHHARGPGRRLLAADLARPRHLGWGGARVPGGGVARLLRHQHVGPGDTQRQWQVRHV